MIKFVILKFESDFHQGNYDKKDGSWKEKDEGKKFEEGLKLLGAQINDDFWENFRYRRSFLFCGSRRTLSGHACLALGTTRSQGLHASIEISLVEGAVCLTPADYSIEISECGLLALEPPASAAKSKSKKKNGITTSPDRDKSPTKLRSRKRKPSAAALEDEIANVPKPSAPAAPPKQQSPVRALTKSICENVIHKNKRKRESSYVIAAHTHIYFCPNFKFVKIFTRNPQNHVNFDFFL